MARFESLPRPPDQRRLSCLRSSADPCVVRTHISGTPCRRTPRARSSVDGFSRRRPIRTSAGLHESTALW